MIKKQPLPTDLIGDKTVKTDERINFFGEIDELSALIMEFTHYVDDERLKMELRKIVKVLSICLAETAGGMGKVGELYLSELLDLVKEYEGKLGAFCGFVLPGETLLGAKAHVVRTVTRRAERAYAKVYEKYGGSEIIFQYLNRLSTFFFALARTFDEK